MSKWLVFIILFGLFHFARAENHLYYFGGGSSDVAGDKMFDQTLKDALDYSKNEKWQGTFYYTKRMPEGLNEADRQKIKSFTDTDGLHTQLDQIRGDMASGKIKSGEQVMIQLSSHGDLLGGKLAITTDDSQTFVESQIKSLIQMAEEKHVKLGIVGINCYAGTLMKYRSPNTCVVAFSQADQVGWMQDGTNFSDYVSKNHGKSNLEEAYLESRLKSRSRNMVSQPMISTEAGAYVDNVLSSLRGGIRDGGKVVKDLEPPACRSNFVPMQDFQRKIEDLEKLTTASSQRTAQAFMNSEELRKKSIDQLKEKMRRYDELQAKMDSSSAGQKICYEKRGLKYCKTNAEVFTHLKKLTNPTVCLPVDPTCPDRVQQELATYRNYENIPEYKNFLKNQFDYIDAINEMNDLSGDIAVRERVLYQDLYKAADKKMKSPNPCRDFKL